MDIDNTAADMDLFQEAGNLESKYVPCRTSTLTRAKPARSLTCGTV
jgi:hypothetical protein